MSRIAHRRLAAVALASAATMGIAGSAFAAQQPTTKTGPSSSDVPYLVPQAAKARITSLLTAGDTVGAYTMAGTPDGLGAFDNGDGTFTVLMNHEFANTVGGPRSHGNAAGSFVSRWVIDKKTLKVISGTDQIKNLVTTGSKDINRLCSADLPDVSAVYNKKTKKGYNGRIFFNGEESAPTGRAFAHVVSTGDSYELSALGLAGWENLAANPSTGDRTVLVGQSDGGTQNVYVYAGTKQKTGSPIEQAGLTNGVRKAIAVDGFAAESGSVDFPSTPQKFTLSDTGTAFDRPEDGAWDPKRPNDYYFVTTASMTKHSRLWRARFIDAAKPELGGTLTKLFEGPADDSPASVGPKMMDNLTVDDGKVLLQEDPGGNAYLAGIYSYDIKRGTVTKIVVHDPARFTPGGALFETIDEESSGIIPAPFLGEGAYLFDDQNHTKSLNPAQVEKGQLLLLKTDD